MHWIGARTQFDNIIFHLSHHELNVWKSLKATCSVFGFVFPREKKKGHGFNSYPLWRQAWTTQPRSIDDTKVGLLPTLLDTRYYGFTGMGRQSVRRDRRHRSELSAPAARGLANAGQRKWGTPRLAPRRKCLAMSQCKRSAHASRDRWTLPQ